MKKKLLIFLTLATLLSGSLFGAYALFRYVSMMQEIDRSLIQQDNECRMFWSMTEDGMMLLDNGLTVYVASSVTDYGGGYISTSDYSFIITEGEEPMSEEELDELYWEVSDFMMGSTMQFFLSPDNSSEKDEKEEPIAMIRSFMIMLGADEEESDIYYSTTIFYPGMDIVSLSNGIYTYTPNTIMAEQHEFLTASSSIMFEEDSGLYFFGLPSMAENRSALTEYAEKVIENQTTWGWIDGYRTYYSGGEGLSSGDDYVLFHDAGEELASWKKDLTKTGLIFLAVYAAGLAVVLIQYFLVKKKEIVKEEAEAEGIITVSEEEMLRQRLRDIALEQKLDAAESAMGPSPEMERIREGLAALLATEEEVPDHEG